MVTILNRAIKMISVFSVLIAVFLFSFPISAEELPVSTQRLFDNAGYFSEEQAETLNELLLSTEESVGFYVSILVSDNIGSDKSEYGAMDYADVFYEEHFGINTDGVIYLLNLDTDHDRISTSGYAIKVFTDARIESTFDYFWDDMVDKKFYEGMEKFCDRVLYYAALESPDNKNNTDQNNGAEYDSSYEYEYTVWDELDSESAFKGFVIGGFMSVVVSLIVVISTVSRYKAKPAKKAESYLKRDTVRYHQSTDTFVRQYTTSRVIESSSSGGGGGSSTHSSSGGGTHGGGGRSR